MIVEYEKKPSPTDEALIRALQPMERFLEIGLQFKVVARGWKETMTVTVVQKQDIHPSRRRKILADKIVYDDSTPIAKLLRHFTEFFNGTHEIQIWRRNCAGPHVFYKPESARIAIDNNAELKDAKVWQVRFGSIFSDRPEVELRYDDHLRLTDEEGEVIEQLGGESEIDRGLLGEILWSLEKDAPFDLEIVKTRKLEIPC